MMNEKDLKKGTVEMKPNDPLGVDITQLAEDMAGFAPYRDEHAKPARVVESGNANVQKAIEHYGSEVQYIIGAEYYQETQTWVLSMPGKTLEFYGVPKEIADSFNASRDKADFLGSAVAGGFYPYSEKANNQNAL